MSRPLPADFISVGFEHSPPAGFRIFVLRSIQRSCASSVATSHFPGPRPAMFVKCSRLFKLTVGQRNLAAGGQSSCELGEQSRPVRISGRGPRPVGRGGIPVLERLMARARFESSSTSVVFAVMPGCRFPSRVASLCPGPG